MNQQRVNILTRKQRDYFVSGLCSSFTFPLYLIFTLQFSLPICFFYLNVIPTWISLLEKRNKKCTNIFSSVSSFIFLLFHLSKNFNVSYFIFYNFPCLPVLQSFAHSLMISNQQVSDPKQKSVMIVQNNKDSKIYILYII